MTDDELRKRVARAMCLSRGIDPDDALPEEMREGDGPWPYWGAFADDATAALAAIRPVIRNKAVEEAESQLQDGGFRKAASFIRALKEKSST